VTHDQTEAMRLGDRVVVMRGGVVQQVDTPQFLYEHPVNLFVAGFIGSPAMNFLPAQLEDNALQCALGELRLSDRMRHTLEATDASREVILGVRPEHFEDAALVEPGAKEHGVTFAAQVEVLESMGSDKYAHFSLEGEQASAAELDELAADAGTADVLGTGQLVTRLSAASAATEGERMQVWFDPDRIQVFHRSNGRNLAPTLAHLTSSSVNS
jgi:multiple sugar transport system ATP-binding protein